MSREIISETVSNLRALADRLASSGMQLKRAPIVSIDFHGIAEKVELAAIARLMDDGTPRTDRGGQSQWVQGNMCGCKATAFYRAGLLGKTKKEVVVEVEDSADLASLFEQPPVPSEAELAAINAVESRSLAGEAVSNA